MPRGEGRHAVYSPSQRPGSAHTSSSHKHPCEHVTLQPLKCTHQTPARKVLQPQKHEEGGACICTQHEAQSPANSGVVPTLVCGVGAQLGKPGSDLDLRSFQQGFSVRLYASTLYAVRCTQYAARPVQYLPTVRCCTLCVPFSSVAAAGMCAGSGLALSGSRVRKGLLQHVACLQPGSIHAAHTSFHTCKHPQQTCCADVSPPPHCSPADSVSSAISTSELVTCTHILNLRYFGLVQVYFVYRLRGDRFGRAPINFRVHCARINCDAYTFLYITMLKMNIKELCSTPTYVRNRSLLQAVNQYVTAPLTVRVQSAYFSAYLRTTTYCTLVRCLKQRIEHPCRRPTTPTATRQLQEATPSHKTSHQGVGEWHAWVDGKPSKTRPATCRKEPHTSCQQVIHPTQHFCTTLLRNRRMYTRQPHCFGGSRLRPTDKGFVEEAIGC